MSDPKDRFYHTYTGPMRALDAREFRFVEEYVCGGPRERGNVFKAAVAAGYTPSTATAWGPSWLKRPSDERHPTTGRLLNEKPWVWLAIEERRAELEHMFKIDKNFIIEELAKLARLNAAAYTKVAPDGTPYVDLSTMTHDELAAIGEVTVDEYKEGRGEDAVDIKKFKIKPYDKRAALMDLAKILGVVAPQKVMHGNDPDNPMPGAIPYDLTKLSDGEVKQLQALLKKAAPPTARQIAEMGVQQEEEE